MALRLEAIASRLEAIASIRLSYGLVYVPLEEHRQGYTGYVLMLRGV